MLRGPKALENTEISCVSTVFELSVGNGGYGTDIPKCPAWPGKSVVPRICSVSL